MNQVQIAREVRRHLGSRGEQRNKLNGAIDAAVTTATFTYQTKGIKPGSYIEMDNEAMYVWETPTALTATVKRGELGSTAATHVNGVDVIVSPNYPMVDILKAVADEVRVLPVLGVYRKRSAALTFDTVDYDYSLSGITDLLSVYMLTYKVGGYDRYSYNISAESGASILRDYDYGGYSDTLAATLWYRATFGPLAADLNEDVSISTGLPASSHDILAYGAAARLLMPDEVRRVSLDVSPVRASEDVPPRAIGGATMFLQGQRDLLIQTEARRLRAEWPLRRRN